MAKQKKLISFTVKHFEMLTKMMSEDGQESVSYFLGGLLAEEWKKREEYKNKRPQGRPRKEDNDEADEPELTREEKYADDLPKTILYMGQRIGPREDHDISELQKMFQPK